MVQRDGRPRRRDPRLPASAALPAWTLRLDGAWPPRRRPIVHHPLGVLADPYVAVASAGLAALRFFDHHALVGMELPPCRPAAGLAAGLAARSAAAPLPRPATPRRLFLLPLPFLPPVLVALPPRLRARHVGPGVLVEIPLEFGDFPLAFRALFLALFQRGLQPAGPPVRLPGLGVLGLVVRGKLPLVRGQLPDPIVLSLDLLVPFLNAPACLSQGLLVFLRVRLEVCNRLVAATCDRPCGL